MNDTSINFRESWPVTGMIDIAYCSRAAEALGCYMYQKKEAKTHEKIARKKR
ncbi:MAG: hypothetical protein IBX72_06885 [Nitrospirae bacterium]|nr:hypothetical protein [Nitrospirota bacterium]